MWTIGKRFSFDAAHWIEGLPEHHKCSRLHGHTYVVELVLGSAELSPPGFVLDYGELVPFKALLAERYDHQCLNDLPEFKDSGLTTTAEHLAALFFGAVRRKFPDWPLIAVRVSETPNTWAEYRP